MEIVGDNGNEYGALKGDIWGCTPETEGIGFKPSSLPAQRLSMRGLNNRGRRPMRPLTLRQVDRPPGYLAVITAPGKFYSQRRFVREWEWLLITRG